MGKKVIGIDLGTGFSCLSVMENGKPTIIVNADGNRTMPSVVAFTDDGKVVGSAAKRQATTNSEKTIFEAKRLIGRKYKDKDVQSFEKISPFKLSEGTDGEVVIEIDDEQVSPVEISAAILSELKKYAEEYLGEEVTDAVVTVPAYFNDSQRQATKDAGKIAGLNVKRIVNEPTAAALAYGMGEDKNEKVLIVDTGAGTHDVSLLDLGDGVTEVIATSGDTFLGGTDFDQRIVEWLADEFKKTDGIDLREDNMALQRLKEESEKAKKELSSTNEVEINIPFVTADASGPKHLNIKLSRAKFEDMTSDLVEKILVPCRTVLEDSKTEKDDIDEVILVGGSTRIPAIQKAVESFFGKKANKSVNPDEVVAMGAAIQGGIFMGEVDDVLLLDVTPLSLSIETLGGVATRLIEKNTTIPTNQQQVFSTAEANQPIVSIHVLQGERPMAMDNKTLGKFDLSDIPPAPRGIPQIEVKFDIDADGILSVTAKDLGTNKEQTIVIKDSSGLSAEDIDRMVKDAEEHAEDDKIKKEFIDTKNQGEGAIFQVEKALKEHEELITEEEKELIETKITELKEVLTKDVKDDIVRQMEHLNDAFHKVSEKIYAQNPPEGPPMDGPPEGFNPEDFTEGGPKAPPKGFAEAQATGPQGPPEEDVVDVKEEETNTK